MAIYVCSHCKFRLNSERSPRDCPYCGKSTLEREKTASELLGEVDELLQD